jgi:AraC family transcriptional regulator of adaptative response / DNA-3-methyladenine glycosylase II
MLEPVHDDFDRCYRAVQSRDARFDGWFVTAVLTTGIYCRPSCPVRLPLARNVRFYPTAAAAQRAGFRACRRCLPDASPGSPLWNIRADVVARAMRLIADGTVDREGVSGLAARLAYTTRQLERLLRSEVGAGPLALARAQRVQTARILIETTSMAFGDVAFAAGFASIRQFNDTVRAACGTTPTMLRSRVGRRAGRADSLGAGQAGSAAGQVVSLRLAVREPFAYEGVFGHLAAAAVPGCEEVSDAGYRRTLRLPFGSGIVTLSPQRDHVRCTLALADVRDLSAAIGRCRRLLDLDADPEAVIEALCADEALRAVVAKAPGQRIPGTVDPDELAVRAVLGQQVSTAAARTHTRRLVEAYGTPLADPAGALTHLFPTVGQLADIDPAHLAVPRARQTSLRTMVAALASGELRLDPGVDWREARRQLRALPGVGPWTAEIIAMRGLGDPDAFPVRDLGVLHAAAQCGLPTRAPELVAHSERWRPWRSYVTQHLWATLDHPVNQWPPTERAS